MLLVVSGQWLVVSKKKTPDYPEVFFFNLDSFRCTDYHLFSATGS